MTPHDADSATLAPHDHEAGDGGALLIHFCASQGGKDNKPAARIIAEKVADPKQSEALPNQRK